MRAQTRLRAFSLSGADFRKSLAAYVGADAALRARLDERADLDHFELFEQLGSREKDLLLARMHIETYQPGQVVVQAGDPQGDFYCIRSGHVEVTLEPGEADASPLRIMGPGQFFGEIALLLGTTRTATVTAVEETRLWVLSRNDFHELLGQYFNLESTLADVARERFSTGHVLLDPTPPPRSESGNAGAEAPEFSLESWRRTNP